MQKKKQQGNIIMVIVPVLAVVLLIAIGSIWWVLSHKKPTPKPQTTTVSADEPLTNGDSNADLNQDVQILSAGLGRDGSYVSSTNTALNDQPQTILND